MFSAEDIYARTRKQPFVPFRIHTTAGKAYDILHPDMAFTLQRCVRVSAPTTGQLAPDRDIEIAMIHISELEELEQKAPVLNVVDD